MTRFRFTIIYVPLLLGLVILLSAFLFLAGAVIGFPFVHPVDADCIGYRYEKPDDGINRVYCYGIIYNLWFE